MEPACSPSVCRVLACRWAIAELLTKLTVGVDGSVNGVCLYRLALPLVQGSPHFLPQRARIGRDGPNKATAFI